MTRRSVGMFCFERYDSRFRLSLLLVASSLLSSSDGAIDRRARWSGRSRERDRRGEVIRVARGASRRSRVCVLFCFSSCVFVWCARVMVKTRVTCYFEVPGARKVRLGLLDAWYVDVDISENDTKAEVKREICVATGVKYSDLKLRTGSFYELLAFDTKRYADMRVGSCGATGSIFDKKLLRQRELNEVGALASELPEWDPKKYDGRYNWVQERPEERKS